jgi:hypothetical protein
MSKKIPTKDNIHNLSKMTIKELRKFGTEFEIYIPNYAKKKEDILKNVIEHSKYPSNIDIDNRLNLDCEIPDHYNKKVWNVKIKEAKKEKKWALQNIDKFDIQYYDNITNKMIIERLEKSVCEIAKKNYDYFDMRAHAKGELGTLIDPSDAHKWEEIVTGKKYQSKGLLDF